MKTENKYEVGQRWQHRKQDVVVEIVDVNEKGKTVIVEDETGKSKSFVFSAFSKSYKQVEEDEKPAKKGKGKKADKEEKPAKKSKKDEKPKKGEKAEKPAKADKKSKGKKASDDDVSEGNSKPDPKWADIVSLMKKHNKKDVGTLLSIVVIFDKGNFNAKYTDIQRSYRITNNQPGLMPKAAANEVVYMSSLAGDDSNVDYNAYNFVIEDAWVEVGDEELPDYSDEE